MEITVLPKDEFDIMMVLKSINDSNVEDQKNLYLISINYSDFPEWMPEEAYPHFKQDHPNVLRLFYDDVLQDTRVHITAQKEWWTAKAFTSEQAKQVVDFLSKIEKNDDTKIIVHCKAGKSRSVATAHFVSEFFGIDPNLIYTNPEQKPNATVLNLLREANSTHKCPKCQTLFYLCNPGNCWCDNVTLSMRFRNQMKNTYDSCLCPNCLKED
jgi:rhodanese-related sulfurtransferase